MQDAYTVNQRGNLLPSFLTSGLTNFINPIASAGEAPNFFERSISECSLETNILKYKVKSFASLVDFENFN